MSTPLPQSPPKPPEPSPSPTPNARRSFFERYGGRFFYISLIAHVLFAIVATWFVVQRIEQRKLNFKAGNSGPSANTRAQEHKVQVKKTKSLSAPAQAKRITTTAVSARVAIPEMKMPAANEVVASRMAGMGGGTGFAVGSMSAGGPGGGNGTGKMPFFGLRGAGYGLVGTLYDLKQGPNLRPNEMAPAGGELTTQMAPGGWVHFPQMKKYCQTIASFIRNGWSPLTFSPYYRAPNKLTTTQIFIPQILAEEAPKAFSVEKTVVPRRWLIHYSASVIPPKDGEFRFVGYGDDILLVRINGRNVLDANFPDEKIIPEANSKEPEDRGGDNSPFYKGTWFNLRKDSPVRMDVLIGEGPGGHLRAFLLIDEKAAQNAPGDYAVFQLKDTPLPNAGNQLPRGFTGKKMIFGVSNSSAFTGF